MMQLKEEVKETKESTVFVGVVSSLESYEDIPVVVAAYAKADGKRNIIHYTTLHKLGPYELFVPQGTHNIIAFIDENQNLTFDAGEPAGQILSAEQVSIPAGGVAGNLDIVVSKEKEQVIDLPVGFSMPPKEYKQFHSTCPGAIADLNDVVFSDAFAKKGLWTPLEFYKEIGGNIYFLEPYDPNKIPILFVHGVAGSPQNWRTFFDRIDRDRFQPWFYYYPSGTSIDSMAYLLFWKLTNLYTQYQFEEMVITAHSMGGLVTRAYLVNFSQYIQLPITFVSISTPWGGESLAEVGVDYSPVVIPAWIDMQPDSACITSLFERDLPPTVDHYLFFGHKGNRNILRPNTDKVVTLASQLDERSQSEAIMVYGFHEDHVSILSSEQVLSHYNAILTDRYQKAESSNQRAGNRFSVDFSFDFPKESPHPMLMLMLRPVDQPRAEMMLTLRPEDTGREHGPFPAGQYEVSLIAPAFMVEPASHPLHLEEGRVPNVSFRLKPVGFIRGYVAKKEPNIQAGKFREPDADVRIQSITLKGNGVNRSLNPTPSAPHYDMLYPEHSLSGTDFSAQGAFFFFNLPAGQYVLSLHAQGYRPYTMTYQVKPGHYQNVIVIELEPETD
ncbi:lipase family alpha/beta hydrolase [Planctomycetota bacterium]